MWLVIEKRQTSYGVHELEHDMAETEEEAVALAQRLRDKDAKLYVGARSEFFVERMAP